MGDPIVSDPDVWRSMEPELVNRVLRRALRLEAKRLLPGRLNEPDDHRKRLMRHATSGCMYRGVDRDCASKSRVPRIIKIRNSNVFRLS